MIIGITGSIAMGKTSTALIFSKYNIKVFDADKQIKQLFLKDNIIKEIRDLNPRFVKNNQVKRNIIADYVFSNQEILNKLENILYPELNIELEIFLKSMTHSEIAILDMPLLFEKNYNSLCNLVILVYCSKYIQKIRALKRKYMNKAKLKTIIANQIHPYIKKMKADHIIYTDRDTCKIKFEIHNIVRNLRCA